MSITFSKSRLVAFALMTSLALTACGGSNNTPTGQGFDKVADKVAVKVKTQMETKDITLKHTSNANSVQAVLTPQGDVIIDGTPVNLSAEQRQRVLEYRTAIIQVAANASKVGVAGASFAMRTAKDAVFSVATGKNQDEVNKKTEQDAKKFEEDLKKGLCPDLAQLVQVQAKLIAVMPEFKNYKDDFDFDMGDCPSQNRSTAQAQTI